jgi:hypothetical protein
MMMIMMMTTTRAIMTLQPFYSSSRLLLFLGHSIISNNILVFFNILSDVQATLHSEYMDVTVLGYTHALAYFNPVPLVLEADTLPRRPRVSDTRLGSLGPEQLPIAGSLRKLNSGNWSAKLLVKPKIVHRYETNCDVTQPLHPTVPPALTQI